MDWEDLARLDAHGQSALVRSNRISAYELAEAAIFRVEATRSTVNAVAITRYEQALSEARALGPMPGKQEPVGSPVAGVPFLLKDLGPTCAGLEATAGSDLLAGAVATRDGTLTARFRKAGLIFLGSSNTAEFGVLPTTEPRRYGPTRNPWAPGRSAGGSSGGAAAAVAACLVPVAHANDAGGSIRIPAACCGVFGLKPTRARTPLGPEVGDLMNGMACEHVLSRSVRDSAAVLDLIAGPAAGDPYCAPPQTEPYAQAARRPSNRLRIAVTVRSGLEPLDPACVEAVWEAARLCAELGHEVIEAAPPITMADVAEDFLTVWAAGVSSAVTARAAVAGRHPAPELVEDVTWWLYEEGRQRSSAAYLLAVIRLQRAARVIADFHDHYDVQLGAVTSWPAPVLGSFDTGPPQARLLQALAFAYETPLANLTGQPAMSVPIGKDGDGVPAGVQFTGRFGAEATLFSLAGELERARPWADRLPVLATVPASVRSPLPDTCAGDGVTARR